ARASGGDSDDEEAPVVAARPAAPARKVVRGGKAVAFDARWLEPYFSKSVLHKAVGDFREEQWSAAEAGFLKGASRLPASSDERHAAKYLAGLAKANQGK